MTHSNRRPRHGERGSALIEVALTLPLLLLVSVGIFEFGRAFQTWQILTNAAREGARVAVLPNATQAEIERRVRDYMEAGLLSEYDTASVNVNQAATISIGSGTASASVVSIAYPFDFVVLNPIARLVVSNSNLGASQLTMTTSAAMRNESQY